MTDDKQKIINLFEKNVFGKKYTNEKKSHCGSEGHWLEELIGIKHNSKTEADIYGYELKSKTSSKTSFGDWCPDIDENGKPLISKWWNNDESKKKFMIQYGGFNKEKNRWSWCNPIKFNNYNKFGQKFIIEEDGIYIAYNNKKDTNYDSREINKSKIEGDLLLFGWSHDEMDKKIQKKFNQNGYIRPIKSEDGVYIGIQFGKSIDYKEFIENIKKDNIYLDPGTYVGNSRPYMQWRANNKWFDNREKNNLDYKYIMKNEKTENKNIIKNNKINNFTAVDLFCGCGGLTTGLTKAGISVLAGIDIWDKAIETYVANHNHYGLCRDLINYKPTDFIKDTKITNFDLLVGGPPCQGFSMAGKRDNKDPRNSLFMEYVKYLNYFKPKAFIMENVVGILSMKTQTGELVKDIILDELGVNYECSYYKLSAADFEVPQNRKRIIFIGFRKDLNVKPREPDTINAKNHIPVRTILDDKSKIDTKYFLSEKALNGIKRKKELMLKKGNGFGAQFLNLDKPSFTIPARYWKDGYDALVKYSETEIRKLTIKELAKIQTFPDDYNFKGSDKEIIMQIGNAVACRFAYHLGKHTMKLLNNNIINDNDSDDIKPKKVIKSKMIKKEELSSESESEEEIKPKKIVKSKTIKSKSSSESESEEEIKPKKIVKSKTIKSKSSSESESEEEIKPKKIVKKKSK
jgi:DNA (cytosine-5)-methyltransferase 1